MAETKTTTRKPQTRKSKAVPDVIENIEEDAKVVEEKVVEEVDVLEGKTVQELRDIHKEALVLESEAKRTVHTLRMRAANLATDFDTKAEEDIIAAKKELAKAAQWLRRVESALENEFKDISGIHKF